MVRPDWSGLQHSPPEVSGFPSRLVGAPIFAHSPIRPFACSFKLHLIFGSKTLVSIQPGLNLRHHRALREHLPCQEEM